MQRQLWVKFLSKIPRNVSSNNNSISPSSVFSSSFLKAGNPLYQRSFSQHSTLSHSQIWRLCSSNGVRNGFISSPVLVRSFFSTTLLKGQNKFPVNGAIRSFSRRYFHSFDSQYRGWRSVFRRLTADGVVIGLVAANVAVFILWRVADPQFMVNNFMIGRTFGPEYLLKLYLSGAVVGSIFYLAYHGFIAPSFQNSLHNIILNMLNIITEGSKKSKQMFGIDPSKIPGLGASGAVNAILLLDIFLFPTKTLYLDFIIPVPAILLGIFIIGKDALRILEGDREVSGSAHLGGATVAALAWAWSRRGRYRRF
ncbi:hypothetical protein PHJA_002885100 [Phtheirospermum japonicum]|uniref:Peptidase S54 rhomboid domain-containing protein n=1 Tax=Phtheirospermum japonicum TaxID=374723 RepID=A0A830D837_9LAMI|nr:hypothetical protein PHJA_002885100 [Phtheirospermum japonicum]